ncbi:hypothetical protein [Sorangium atrum]|uniref:Luciferase-like domain-containing protein n=1 Tax=Sorangium atrum TaxID=2995308 RepID=A0ABT5BVS4_9BACT|nr:hypothetical protein [Sorangium aterium]MDC0678257.1 hypothetical protein [Sorangium aterium]
MTNRSIYDIHVPLDREALAEAHRQAGFNVLWSDYMLPVDASLFGVGCIEPPWLRLPVLGAASAVTGLVWALDARGLAPRPNLATSPYLFCVARGPEPPCWPVRR